MRRIFETLLAALTAAALAGCSEENPSKGAGASLDEVLSSWHTDLPVAKPYRVDRYKLVTPLRGSNHRFYRLQISSNEFQAILTNKTLCDAFDFRTRTKFFRNPRIDWWTTTATFHVFGIQQSKTNRSDLSLYLISEGSDDFLFIEAYFP
jgi:Prokaryotic membrane lipoprotein lipid attachment site